MSKSFIVAEIANAHGHDLAMCKRLLISSKNAGADAFKVATYTADDLTLRVDRPEFSINHKIWSKYGNLWDLYDNIHMPWEFHSPLFELGKSIDIDVFSSPFSIEGVNYLETNFDPPYYKIASMESVHYPLIEHIAKLNKPIIISFGRSRSIDEIKYGIDLIRRYSNNEIVILHCISEYPTPISKANLSSLIYLKEVFKEAKVKVGISDHSDGILIPMLAVAMGAEVIEKHITLTKEEFFENGMPNPDVEFSLTPEYFKVMCEAVRKVEQLSTGLVELNPLDRIASVLLKNPHLRDYIRDGDLNELHLSMGNYESINPEVKSSGGFRRSLIYTKNIKRGEVLSLNENFAILRPGHGLNPIYLDQINGKRILDDVEKGEGVRIDHV
jgi:pseudaminic acid synthase